VNVLEDDPSRASTGTRSDAAPKIAAVTSRPLAELLAETHDAVVLRLHGRPRDPDSGRDKVTVVYVPVTASAGRVAGVLRDVADKLERGAR
jgi:hypothetical protein